MTERTDSGGGRRSPQETLDGIGAALESAGLGEAVSAAVAGLEKAAQGTREERRARVGALGSPQDIMTTARILEREDHTGADGLPVRRFWRGSFHDWTGTHWRERLDADVEAALWKTVEHAQYLHVTAKGAVRAPWAPDTAKINNLRRALAAVLNTPAEAEQGRWLDGRAQQVRPVACRNVLVDPLTGAASPHSAAYFNGYSLEFDYDPDAGCPAWLGFLESVWPGDEESKLLLQQWFGYVLSGRTDLQKLMYMKGLARSGKGTIARILAALLGPDSVCGPDFESFGRDFGMELMTSCQLAVVGDARFTGDQRTMQAAIGKLLSITGEDKVQVNRKYKQAWTGTLPTRLMLMSNEMPWFRDSSAAIAGRMLLLVFKESFLGREDLTLDLRLRAELAGIFNWALAGYRELAAADGRFACPEASADVLGEFRESVSPVKAWLEAECVQDEGVLTASGGLYARWCAYCAENGVRPGAVNGFLRLVQTVWPKVSRYHTLIRDTEGNRVKAWRGIAYRGPAD